MKKDLGILPAVFPMPVLMIGTYDENGKPDVMNAAWGIVCDNDKIALFLSEDHKTVKNFMATKAFTVSIADKDHVEAADYFGIASGNDTEDKFERTGLHQKKSSYVNAPVIEEFPVVMECELADTIEKDGFFCVVGKIVNTAAEEKILSSDGKINPEKINALLFDTFRNGYYTVGEKAGTAWDSGVGLMK